MAKPKDRKPRQTPDKGAMAEPGRPKKKRFTTHRFRWNVRLILGVPLALAFVVLLVMRSPLVGSVVASSLKQLTGCTLEGTGTTGAYIGLDGRLVLNHFQLRLPG